MELTLAFLTAFNTQVNSEIKYHADPFDYWQSPAETAELGTGDCEDYAIVKYYRLRKLGVPDSKMRLVYSFEEGGHIGLLVDGKWLDNRNNRVEAYSGQPVFSFNESGLYVEDKTYPINSMSKWVRIVNEKK